MNECKLVIDVKAKLGEGPIWDSEKQVLYWVDILGQNLHIYDPVSKINNTHINRTICFNGCAAISGRRSTDNTKRFLFVGFGLRGTAANSRS